MKRLAILLAIVALVFTGCSSKTVTWNTMGQKSVTTKTAEDSFHEQQSIAWAGYYEALKNPPVIATIQQIDGTVLTINSQIPPPAPVIRQHQNQIIGPVVDVLKYGIVGTAAYGITRGIVRGAGDVNVTNSGDGTVITDRSDNIASKSSTDLITSTDRSDHSAVADPTIVTQPEPTIVDPVIVEQPPPVIVDPSYPPEGE
jgi:uncharacterized protein YceK